MKQKYYPKAVYLETFWDDASGDLLVCGVSSESVQRLLSKRNFTFHSTCKIAVNMGIPSKEVKSLQPVTEAEKIYMQKKHNPVRNMLCSKCGSSICHQHGGGPCPAKHWKFFKCSRWSHLRLSVNIARK